MSKEEIEKAKEILKNYIIEWHDTDIAEAIETLLQYIDQLEQENNKQNKIIDEMSKWLVGFTFSGENDIEEIFCDKEEVKQHFEEKVEGKLNES